MRDGLWQPADPDWLRDAANDVPAFLRSLREPETVTDHSTVAAALVAARAEIPTVAKDSVNPHFKNRYASLDTIIEAVMPVLARHGLTVVQGTTAPDRDEAGRVTAFTVTTQLLHRSGESLTSAVVVPLAKADAQGAGGALTYGRRYGLAALLCLATDDDDDGHRASQKAKAAPARAAAPAPTSGRTDGKVMPFGPHKGARLASLDSVVLTETAAWCRGKDAVKFADLINSIESELDDRRAAGVA